MKKIIICALAALSVSAVLTSCGGNYRCSVCYDKCSDSNSYKDGEYILCNDCKKDLFKDTVESDPANFFGEEVAAE